MIRVPGFSCGYVGSAGGSLSGFQRVARKAGRPVPTSVTGKKGQGRADRLRSYTVHVVRESDGRRLEKTVGPGYHNRAHWQEARASAQRDLLEQLGWRQ